MKSRETKAKDLAALTESLEKSKSAMVVSFTKLSVTKDQEFRKSLREAGASYQVVKNTLARIAVKGTQFEDATESFKGVTAIAWTENDPVVLSKAISKFMKENSDIYTFKSGVVDGKLVDLAQLTTIANLPSKEELISKLLWVLNSSAERLVTVINAVPRDLAVVIKQIGEAKPAAEVKAEAPAPAPAVEEAAPAEAEVAADAPAEEAPAVEAASAEETPAAEAAPAEETAEAVAEPAAVEAPAEVEAAPEDTVEAPAEAAAEEAAPEAEAEEKAE
ncbi:hypothetical protein BH10ACI3_BH10ACI3_00740 [soil metagenome]